jgi:hypothetical protein
MRVVHIPLIADNPGDILLSGWRSKKITAGFERI